MELEESWGEGKLQSEFTRQVAGRTGCERRPAYSQVTQAWVTVPRASNLVCMHFKVLLYKIVLVGDSCIKGAWDLMVIGLLVFWHTTTKILKISKVIPAFL